MTIRSRKDNIRTLVIDTITLLCKNSLPAEGGFSIEGTIGVSSLKDEDDVFLIPIKEIIKAVQKSSDSDSDATTNSYTSSRRKKRRRRSKENEIAVQKPLTPDPFNNVRLKIENQSDSDSGDLVMVKEEPSLAHQRQLQATQLNANESAALNDAVSNLSGLNQIQSFQPFPGWPSPQMLSPLHHHQQQQQHHHQQQQQHHQMMQQQKRQHTPQMQPNLPQLPFPPNRAPPNRSAVVLQLDDSDKYAVCKKILQCDGSYVTLRTATRKIGRYPSVTVRSVMMNFLSTIPQSERFVGLAKDITQLSHRTTVFYKCPPHLLKQPGAVRKYFGLSPEEYATGYHRPNQDQKPGADGRAPRSVMVILSNDPFQQGGEFDPMTMNNPNPDPDPNHAIEVSPSPSDEKDEQIDESTNDIECDEPNGNAAASIIPLINTDTLPLPNFSQLGNDDCSGSLARTREQPIPSFVSNNQSFDDDDEPTGFGENEQTGFGDDSLGNTDLDADFDL